MAKQSSDIVVFDGTKAVTLWGDEGWDGVNAPELDSISNLAARVPWMYRGAEIRANAIASIPFDVVDAVTGEIVDSTDDWQGADRTEFLKDPEKLIWQIAASRTLAGKAYLRQAKNKSGYIKELKYLATGTVKLDIRKSTQEKRVIFSRVVTSITKYFYGAAGFDGTPANDLETIVYLWMPDSDVEFGEPEKYPAKAAQKAAGVLFNMDTATSGFFARGMIHVTAFSVPGGTQPGEKEKLDTWFQNFASGVKNAFKTIFLNIEKMTPIDLGGGLDQLSNIPLTAEKREDICTAFGVPQTKLFNSSSGGLGGGGVVDEATRDLISDMALPEFNNIIRDLNKQVFLPIGLRIVEHHEKMQQFQESEKYRASTFTAYLDAFTKDAELALIMLDAAGLTLSDETYEEITKYIASKKSAPAPVVTVVDNAVTPQPVDGAPDAQVQPAVQPAIKASASIIDELAKWERVAAKNPEREFTCYNTPQVIVELVQRGLKAGDVPGDVFELARHSLKTDSQVIEGLWLAVKAREESR